MSVQLYIFTGRDEIYLDCAYVLGPTTFLRKKPEESIKTVLLCARALVSAADERLSDYFWALDKNSNSRPPLVGTKRIEENVPPNLLCVRMTLPPSRLSQTRRIISRVFSTVYDFCRELIVNSAEQTLLESNTHRMRKISFAAN